MMIENNLVNRGTDMQPPTSVPLLEDAKLQSSVETLTLQSSFTSDSF